MAIAHSALFVVLLQQAVGFIGLFTFANFFEWVLHKHLMHSLRWPYPFHAHALVHHGLFRADSTYHLRDKKDAAKVTFAWWNAPGLLLLHLPIIFGLQYLLGWSILWSGLTALACYYALYEYLHWCMHVPADRWLEKTRVFQWIKEHHRLHHAYSLRNLNVFFPLADWVLGSLISQPSAKVEQRVQTTQPTVAEIKVDVTPTTRLSDQQQPNA